LEKGLRGQRLCSIGADAAFTFRQEKATAAVVKEERKGETLLRGKNASCWRGLTSPPDAHERRRRNKEKVMGGEAQRGFNIKDYLILGIGMELTCLHILDCYLLPGTGM